MVYLQRLAPECQLEKFGFVAFPPAYLVGGSDEDEPGKRFIRRLFSFEDIQAIALLPPFRSALSVVVRGDASPEWIDEFIWPLHNRRGIYVKRDEYYYALSVPLHQGELVEVFTLETWRECSFSLLSKPAPASMVDEAFSSRLKGEFLPLAIEDPAFVADCVVLFWEGRFDLHCLYTRAELTERDAIPGRALVIPGFAMIDESDAIGEGRSPNEIFFGPSN